MGRNVPFGLSPESDDAWHFPADITPEQVVDGDTTDCVVDLGFHTRKTVRLRLFGVDTKEVYGVPRDSAEFQLGTRQSEFAEGWVRDARDSGLDWPFRVWTMKDPGKYGRWISDVSRLDTSESLSDALRDAFDDL